VPLEGRRRKRVWLALSNSWTLAIANCRFSYFQIILGANTIARILVLDELDHVASNPQSLSALFSLSEKTSSALRLVGIANTHTLTANSTCSSVDLSNVQTLHFAPYTPVQLQAIIRTRLADLYSEYEASPTESNDIKKLLPNPSLVLLTKRIANLTGDVRSLFEVLRGAIDLALAAKNQSTNNPLDATIPSVTPQHILSALKAHSPAASKPSNASSTSPATSSGNSEIINKIQNLGLQSRIVLLALLLASKRIEAGLSLTSTNLLTSPKKPHASPMKRSPSAPSPSTSNAAVGIDTQQLYAFYTTTLERQETFDPVSRSDFGDLLNILEGVGLVQLSSSVLSTPSPSKTKRAFGRQASFGAGLGRNGAGTVGEVRLVEGVWTEEVLRGLGISESASGNADGGDLQNEEVKALWVAESNKISKDVKNLALARASSEKERTLGFADASED
jgi:cell division control protein 6